MTDLNLFIAIISVVFFTGAVTGYIARSIEGDRINIEPSEHGEAPL